MSENIHVRYDWVLSLLAQRIAADVMIQEGAITQLKDTKALTKGLRRCQLHTRLLQLALQANQTSIAETRSADLVETLVAVRLASADIVKVEIERARPMLSVLADSNQLMVCLRIAIILLLLEDTSLRRILVGLRCRGGYVSVKICGGKLKNQQLLDKELVEMIRSILHNYGASIEWKRDSGRRLVYFRLNLSNQLNLIAEQS